jgi:hypothetical protein
VERRRRKKASKRKILKNFLKVEVFFDTLNVPAGHINKTEITEIKPRESDVEGH